MDDTEPTWAFVEADRIDLLCDGVVVVIDRSTPAGRWVGVAGPVGMRWRSRSPLRVEHRGRAARQGAS